MSLERLATRGEAIGEDAIKRVSQRLIAQADLPRGIEIAASPQGIVLSGKRLRRRFVTDPEIRNFAR